MSRRKVILTAVVAVLATMVLATSADLRAGVGDFLDTLRDRLDPVLLAHDLLVEPGSDVTLEASLRTGLRLDGIENKRLRFTLGDTLLGEVKTDDDGRVSLAWHVPDAPGDYLITVQVHPDDQGKRAAADTTLLVAARKADAPLVIVDLDKTLVASGFSHVLAGDADPMEGAAVVMSRLAKDHTVVYLTHRPDFLGPTSKAWLSSNRFPLGPVLMSRLTTFIRGSGRYKAERIETLRRTFTNLRFGIGDKISDAQAYAQNGMHAILILSIDWSEDEAHDYEKVARQLADLPDSVDVVTNWAEIAAILFDDARFPKDAMIRRLQDVADGLRHNHHQDD